MLVFNEFTTVTLAGVEFTDLYTLSQTAYLTRGAYIYIYSSHPTKDLTLSVTGCTLEGSNLTNQQTLFSDSYDTANSVDYEEWLYLLTDS
jgi:hypothetical protein